MTYQWNDIRVFLAVARAETLSAAGRILKVDPATVGRRVARLEQSLGAPLFAKSSLGYALTDAGIRLMEQAQRIDWMTPFTQVKDVDFTLGQVKIKLELWHMD